MLYFSPLSVTDDKQRDRNHPFSSSYSAGRAIWGIGAILVLYLGMLWLRADSAYRGVGMYMLQAGGVVLLVGDNTGLEFREVASKGAAQPFIIVYVRFV